MIFDRWLDSYAILEYPDKNACSNFKIKERRQMRTTGLALKRVQTRVDPDI